MEKDLVFDEIFEITEVGEFDTFDFEIPETHCFFANGLLVHNSGDLEQNADVIIGLWRETNVDEYMLVRGLKGRDQGLFECWLKFDINTMTFVESSGPPKEEQPDKEDQRGYG